ncbi:MAG: hypothetical protein WA208_01495 [Thermoanaerobaculia bacterium]
MEPNGRISVRGNGNGGDGRPSYGGAPAMIDQRSETRETRPRWWEVDVGKVAGVVVWLVSTLIVAMGVWYGLVARVEAHTLELRRLEAELHSVGDRAKSKEGAASDLEVVAVRLEAMRQQLEAIDRRVERVEMRQVGMSVEGPDGRR